MTGLGSSTALPHADLLARLREGVEALRADPEVAAGVAEVVAATRRHAGGASTQRLSAEVLAVEGASRIDLDVPVASTIPGASGLKLGVKRLTGFYLNHLGQQVTALGGAVARLGRATSVELGRVDDDVRDLREEVARLVAEVERLGGAGTER